MVFFLMLVLCSGFAACRISPRPIKGTILPDEYFFKPFTVKLNQYFLYDRRWFLIFRAAELLRKLLFNFLLASMKTHDTNFEDFSESRRRIDNN